MCDRFYVMPWISLESPLKISGSETNMRTHGLRSLSDAYQRDQTACWLGRHVREVMVAFTDRMNADRWTRSASEWKWAGEPHRLLLLCNIYLLKFHTSTLQLVMSTAKVVYEANWHNMHLNVSLSQDSCALCHFKLLNFKSSISSIHQDHFLRTTNQCWC